MSIPGCICPCQVSAPFRDRPLICGLGLCQALSGCQVPRGAPSKVCCPKLSSWWACIHHVLPKLQPAPLVRTQAEQWAPALVSSWGLGLEIDPAPLPTWSSFHHMNPPPGAFLGSPSGAVPVPMSEPLPRFCGKLQKASWSRPRPPDGSLDSPPSAKPRLDVRAGLGPISVPPWRHGPRVTDSAVSQAYRVHLPGSS